MLGMLGWLLLAGPAGPPASTPDPVLPILSRAAGRISVWSDRREPYRRGERARVYVRVHAPSYVAVLRVDTDGRLRVLFPREPWDDTQVREGDALELAGSRGRSFLVDDDPGVGYLFAIGSEEPLDFRAITRGDYWDYRLVDGGRIRGDPYVRLTDLATRLVPGGRYDYDVTPYYVERHYDYPRFVCYDCHAYASYRDWDPYRASCSRYRIEIRDDPGSYAYRHGGRNVVTERPADPAPRFVFRDTDPGRPAVPAPDVPALRRRDQETEPSAPRAQPLVRERRRTEGRREPEGEDGAGAASGGGRPTPQAPQSTGEPELRRRRP